MCNYEDVGTQTSKLNKLLNHLQKHKDKIVKERKNSFINWLTHLHANRYDLTEDDSKKSLDAYFQGKLPFKEPKVRKDIPDSFIYHQILKIHSEHRDDLHIVVEDGNLREACEESGIICHKELKEFIELDAVQLSLQNKVIDDNLKEVNTAIEAYIKKNSEQITEKVESLLLSDEYETIHGDQIPGESNEIYVSGAYRPYSIELISDVEHYGDGLFVIGFSASVELTYEYPVYRSEVHELDRDKYYIECLNDHYFNVETTDEFSFEGRIELEYNLDLEAIRSIEDLLKALVEPSITISELDEFQINA
jgi:hypothetical protein